MRRNDSIRGLVALCLAAALFFHALPGPVRAETRWEPVASLSELVSGKYRLICGDVALGVWEDGWLTAAEASLAEPWDLLVAGDSVTLTDPRGVRVTVGPEGLTSGEGSWTVTAEEGLFRFTDTREGQPVILASNLYAANRFRDYPVADAEAAPEIYRSGFALFRLIPEEPSLPPETTAPPETTLPSEPEEPSVPETTLPAETEPGETEPEETVPPETVPPAPELPWNVYFGRLHSHSDISDGTVPVGDLYARARAAGLDFYAVTDHSDSFLNDTQGAIGADGTSVSPDWAAGKAAAAEASADAFLGIYGYEMAWTRSRQLGHILTLGTPGWQSRNQPEYAAGTDALLKYYDALAGVSGSVGIFAHPGDDSGDFGEFGYRTDPRDKAMNLVEIGGEEGFDLKNYLLALEQGWHVAPSVSRHRSEEPGAARTAVLAGDLTEQSLLDAMTRRRVYATTDSDLRVYYEANGSPMGAVIPMSGTVKLNLTVWDPTDRGATVEVLGNSGAVLASGTLPGYGGTLTLTLERSVPWCFLRITQPDGDQAVTAPVWMEQATDMGIADFRTDTQVPTRGKPVSLTLSLYNNEAVDFAGETATFYTGDRVIHAVNLETLPGGETWDYTFCYTCPDIGILDIRAVVRGTVGGEARTYEKNLTLRVRVEDRVQQILVDGSHGADLSYDRLAEIAAKADASVTLAKEITWDALKEAQILVIPAGSQGLEPEFLELAAEFAKNGGDLILCGRSDRSDGSLHWSAEGNRLLKMLGLTLRLQDDTAVDPVENGGAPDKLAVTVFNPSATLCKDMTQEQIYRQNGGSTVSGGTWLVRGFDTALSQDSDGDGGGDEVVLLAAEESRFGGLVMVAGGDFLKDDCLPAQPSLWALPGINQSVLENLLGLKRTQIPNVTIRAARDSGEGTLVSIRGYVTAGTSNARTRFPDMIYIQDETGGIAVTDFRTEGIQIGTAMEIIGQRCTAEGNPALKLVEYRLTGEKAYRFDPDNSRHDDAMDYEKNGGSLLQVEGTVKSMTKTADGNGLTRLTLKDSRGDLAEILVEPYILSGSTGKNDLALEIRKGRTVRARGILHLDGNGKPVLRVRNCDEVVYVPPNIIPKTGDAIGRPLAGMAVSAAALLTVIKKRKKPD